MSWLTEPDSDWDAPDTDYQERRPRNRVRWVALLLGGWLAVSLLVLLSLLIFGGHHSGDNHASTPATSSTPASSAPGLAAGWVSRASDDQTDCAAHSYGKVRTFFTKTPCSTVHRLLATTSQHGRTVVIASDVVVFDTPAQAARYRTLVDTDGTGNISDLLREGVSYSGAPAQLPPAAFASRQDGARVLVAEVGYAAGTSSAADSTLQAIARQAVR